MAQTNIEETLYAQMHEQYLKNDNSKTQVIITYLTAIAFVFTAYGYVYSYPYLHPGKYPSSYASLLAVTTLAAYAILSVLAIISANLGYSSRKEHHITHYIRSHKISGDPNGLIKEKFNNPAESIFGHLPDYYFILFVFFNIAIAGICYASFHFDNALLKGNRETCCHGYLHFPYACSVFSGCCVAILTNILVYIRYYYKYLQIKNHE